MAERKPQLLIQWNHGCISLRYSTSMASVVIWTPQKRPKVWFCEGSAVWGNFQIAPPPLGEEGAGQGGARSQAHSWVCHLWPAPSLSLTAQGTLESVMS